LAFFADFFEDFLADFFFRHHSAFLGLLGLFAFLALLCFSHRDPPVAADPYTIERFG